MYNLFAEISKNITMIYKV